MHRGFYREKEIFLCQFSRPAGQVMPSVSLWLFHVGCAYRRTIILFFDLQSITRPPVTSNSSSPLGGSGITGTSTEETLLASAKQPASIAKPFCFPDGGRVFPYQFARSTTS